MLYSGTWMFSQILKANPNFELGWFFLPNHEDAPIVDLMVMSNGQFHRIVKKIERSINQQLIF